VPAVETLISTIPTIAVPVADAPAFSRIVAHDLLRIVCARAFCFAAARSRRYDAWHEQLHGWLQKSQLRDIAGEADRGPRRALAMMAVFARSRRVRAVVCHAFPLPTWSWCRTHG
jgi:hypothetical protein